MIIEREIPGSGWCREETAFSKKAAEDYIRNELKKNEEDGFFFRYRYYDDEKEYYHYFPER